MAIIITVSNQKGGVGKTTTSAALASGIAKKGKKVLGVDLDPQGNLGFCMGLEDTNVPTVWDVIKEHLPVKEAVSSTEYCDILPSDITLSVSSLENIGGEKRECLLQEALRPVMDYYDYIIIDTPPALNLLTVNAYAVSDFLIIPMASDILSLVGLSQLKETVESVKETLNPRLDVMGILMTRFNRRTILSKDVLEMAEQLAAQMKTVVFQTKIRNGVAIAEAPAHGESIFDYNPRSSAVKDYVELVEEIADRIHLEEAENHG